MMPRLADAPEYVFHTDFPREASAWAGLVEDARWEDLLEIRGEVQKALEAKRGSKKDKKPGQIGSSQEAELVITAAGKDLELLQSFGAERLMEYFIVSKVELTEGDVTGEDARVDVTVTPSSNEKCPRCWNHWVYTNSGNETCPRCTAVLAAKDA
jgi:isoleucyl-tRNA synthetase